MRLRTYLLALFLLGTLGAVRAEPMTPLLAPPAAARLRAQLWRTPAGPTRLRLLLQLADDLVARHEELAAPLDSAASYARQALALSTRLADPAGRIRSLYVLGQLPGASSAADTTGRAELRQGLRLSQQLASPALEAAGWFYLASSYPRTTAELPRKLAGYARAATLFAQAGRPLEHAYVLKTIADMHLLQGHSGQAEQELLHVLALYRAAGHRELHYTYDLLRGATRQVGNYQAALRYGLAAVESAQATHDTTSIAYLYASLASIYKELNQPDQALAYYQRALRHAWLGQSAAGVAIMSVAISRVLLSQHQPGQALRFLQTVGGSPQAISSAVYLSCLVDCYVALGRYAAAERTVGQLLTQARQPATDDIARLNAHLAAGKFYLATKRYAEARPQLQRALGLCRSAGYLLQAASLHQLLFRADSAQGRFPAAIAHFQQYKRLNDSVFNAARNQQLASLEIQYGTRQKEQNIALLTKQSLLQQARLRQREQQRNALLVGAGLLLLLLGLGYNRYRLKQRSNRLLHAQQAEIAQRSQELAGLLAEQRELLTEKEWMLREIHHRVKNNLQVIGSLLHTQADYSADPATQAALEQSQYRVQAMALLHQHLYQADRVGWVPLPTYVQELAAHLLDAFDATARVRLHLDLAPLALPVATATPLGLALNELLINSMKHAFGPGQPGTLTLTGQQLTPTTYQLSVADDGRGLPPDFDPSRAHTLGLTLVTGLSRQLDGEFALLPNPDGRGTVARLRFLVASPAAASVGFGEGLV
ncbi:histidine kinase dimerization/phosphoacceptor domain -containing protein [Hymenobacter bucti]|uniref:Histidine kinase dimerization/phosphoacceptor domain -containing protein n=1 Tax=Hymenobacter bucti TaxID=1844114 RepID=A0ABW4QUE0_9BACT